MIKGKPTHALFIEAASIASMISRASLKLILGKGHKYSSPLAGTKIACGSQSFKRQTPSVIHQFAISKCAFEMTWR
jgi:hypothetical protein